MRLLLCFLTAAIFWSDLRATAPRCDAQDRYQSAAMFSPPETLPVATSQLPAITPVLPAEEATDAQMEGAQVIARVGQQVILACDVAVPVNMLLEANNAKREQHSPEEWEEIRRELMKREIARMIDRKLLFMEFRRQVSDQTWPEIEKNLIEPFDEMEMPTLMKQFKVDKPADVERALTRLGSSLPGARRAFNERVIATELIRSKVKVNEEVSPEEMLAYYQEHLADYEFPSQARWEELAVHKSRFSHPREAYAALSYLGNEVWERAAQQPGARGAVFAEVAKAKSDGFTAKEGGVHDWTTKGSLRATAIDGWLFSGEVGQMSPIIDSGPAFHIVRVLERREAGRKPFTEVQADIRDKLKDERFQKEVEKYLARLRRETQVWTVFTGPTTAEGFLAEIEGNQRRR